MAKRCPSCGYSPIGPFIDNCPICAEPVRNVRSEGRAWSSKLPPWLWWIVGGAAVLVLGVAGCCGVGMWRMSTVFQDARKAVEQARADAEADRRARTVVIAATQLLQEFRDDPATADQKYRGKYLELTGVVERAGRGRDGVPFVILHAGDESAKPTVECFFDFADDGRVSRLAKGETITLRGEYEGQVTNPQVRGCVLVKPNAEPGTARP
jgi:hypothetical protein